MLALILRKIISKKWMIICLLIGNVLLIATSSSCALYENAVLQKMLTGKLASYMEENNVYPGLTLMKAAVNETATRRDMENYRTLTEKAENFDQGLGVKEAFFIARHYKTVTMVSDVLDAEGNEQKPHGVLACYSGIEDHLKITSGRLYEPGVKEGNVIEVIVPKKTFVYMSLMIGQTMKLNSVKDENEENYYVKVVGVFEPEDNADIYWYSSPSNWMQSLIMDEATFKELFVDIDVERKPEFFVDWASVIDYHDFKGAKVQEMVDFLEPFVKEYTLLTSSPITIHFQEIFKTYLTEAAKLRITLLVLEVPIFLLLIVFIFMVSGQMLDMEQKEISIFKSRGASKGQILKVYLEQSLVLAAAGLLLGIPLGFLICQVIGSANAFLEFVGRSALPVSFTLKTALFALGAAVLSILTMVIPAFKYSDVTIVAHKQKKASRRKSPLWQKLFLDVILLGLSIYIVYTFRQNADYLATTISGGSALGPMMYLGSSIFILGAGLLVLRLFPLLVKLIFLLGRRFWSPGLYASFLRIIRERSGQGFLMVFLILTMSLGIFNAQAARTINANGEDRIRYEYGADLVVREVWENTASEYSEGEYIEPRYERYLELDGIEHITRVLQDTVSVSLDGQSVRGAKMMAINTKEFGEVAWMRDGLLNPHWYNYLNAISQDAEGVLLSSNFKTHYGVEVGDVILYHSTHGNARGIVYGFVDYWPTYHPTYYASNLDSMEPNYLVISSFDQIQSQWTVFPYEIWMDVKDSTRFFYDWAEENDVRFHTFNDTTAELIKWKNDPVTQGTNGVLTVGFIVVLVLCAVGFLIFWILSIRSRELQFGIFRAMGMSMREILGMLGNEQIFISGVSLVMGAVIGKIASYLFVPMVQMAYSSSDTVIPLIIADAARDTYELYGVIAVMVIICMVVLSVLISRIRISQALKLGED